MTSRRKPDRQGEILKSLSPEQRWRLAAQLRELNIRLLESGIRTREGDLPPEQMSRRILQHILPGDLYTRFFGPGP